MRDDLDELSRRLWPDTTRLRPRPSGLGHGLTRRHRGTVAAGTTVAVVVAAIVSAVVLVNHRAGGAPGGDASSDHPGSYVPWAATAAPDVARPYTVAGVPPCTVAELTVHGLTPGGGPGMPPPTGLALWGIGVLDTGSSPCFLSPTIDVTFTTASGGALLLSRRPYGDDIVYLLPAGSPARAGFVREVTANVRTFGSCPVQHVARLTLTLGTGLGSVTLDSPPSLGTGGRPCGGGRGDYDALMLSGLGSDGTTTPASTTSLIQAQSLAHPGSRVRFLVTVANAPSAPEYCQGSLCPARVHALTFNPCPSYHEELEGVEGSFHTYRLNCAMTREVTAGSAETFEMYIDVPGNAVPGPAVLAWTMDGPEGLYQPARAVIEIVKAPVSHPSPTPDPCLTRLVPVSMEYRPELRTSVPVPSGWAAGEDHGTTDTTMTPPCGLTHAPRFRLERLDATTVQAALQGRCSPGSSQQVAAAMGPMTIAGHAGSYQYLCQPQTFIGPEWTVLVPVSTGAGVWRVTYLGAADLGEGPMAAEFEAVLQAFQP